MMSADLERRSAGEVRAAGRTLTGYIATWNTEAKMDGFRESIQRGAFAKRGDDILCLADHDMSRVLGRTRSGTLRLNEDAKGLHFELALPDTSAGRDVAALAERGDLGGGSIGFVVRAGGETWEGSRRILTDLELVEVSIVSSHPAYPNTEIALRSLRAIVEADRRRRALILAEARR